jgi:hypothetical protein
LQGAKVRKILAVAVLLTCVGGIIGRAALAQSSRTMASLMAEGYEMQRLRVFKETIWLRKPDGDEKDAYICQRGALSSSTFEAYRNGRYDQVPCSPVP